MTGKMNKIADLIVVLLLLAGCTPKSPTTAPSAPPPPEAVIAPVRINTAPLNHPQMCSDSFVSHTLDHTTTTDDGQIGRASCRERV